MRNFKPPAMQGPEAEEQESGPFVPNCAAPGCPLHGAGAELGFPSSGRDGKTSHPKYYCVYHSASQSYRQAQDISDRIKDNSTLIYHLRRLNTAPIALLDAPGMERYTVFGRGEAAKYNKRPDENGVQYRGRLADAIKTLVMKGEVKPKPEPEEKRSAPKRYQPGTASSYVKGYRKDAA